MNSAVQDADLTPAILELKKLHRTMLDDISTRLNDKVDRAGHEAALSTVISIIPGDRRKENGWYNFRQWTSKTDDILSQLDKEHHAQKFHEIFFAGEALSMAPRDIVVLMMHQVCHQAAGVVSNQSYHSEWMRHWMRSLFGINDEALERDKVFGYGYKLNWAELAEKPKALIQGYVDLVAPENLDLYRGSGKLTQGTGKMMLWHCECRRAPRLRTGAVLRATCDDCGGKILFRDSEKVNANFLSRISDEYLPS